jgi:hypothetical protein
LAVVLDGFEGPFFGVPGALAVVAGDVDRVGPRLVVLADFFVPATKLRVDFEEAVLRVMPRPLVGPAVLILDEKRLVVFFLPDRSVRVSEVGGLGFFRDVATPEGFFG